MVGPARVAQVVPEVADALRHREGLGLRVRVHLPDEAALQRREVRSPVLLAVLVLGFQIRQQALVELAILCARVSGKRECESESESVYLAMRPASNGTGP